MVRIHDLDVVIERDVTRVHRAGPLLVEGQDGLVARVHADREPLQVEKDLGHVLLHALDGGVLVEHPVDLHLGDRGPGDRRKQRTDLVDVDDPGLQQLDGMALHA